MNKTQSGDERFRQMTEEPVRPLVVRLAIPSIVIMMISALYNMADTYFVGTLGTSATASVGVVFSLMALIQACGFFFGHGSGNYISRQLGAQNMEEASKMAAVGFCSAWIAGLVIAVTGTLFLEQFAILLGASETMVEHTCSYLSFILMGAPWMTSSLTLNNLLRFQGSSFYGMVGMTTGAVLNIGLDPLLIYVFDMGVGGAGLATAISQTVSCLILFYCCTRQGNIRVRLRNFRPSLHAYKEIFRGGTPSLCRQGIASVAVVLLNHAAGVYGVAAIAAISIVSRVSQMASSVLMGFGQGFQPVCGFNYGAKRYERVIAAYRFCIKLSFALLVAVSAAGFFFAPQIITLFQNDVDVIRIGTLALRFQCVTFPFMTWYVIGSMMLQTIGKAGRASLMAVARQGLFMIPLLFVLPPAFGVLGIQLCQPVSDCLTLMLSVPLIRSILKEMKHAIAESGTQNLALE